MRRGERERPAAAIVEPGSDRARTRRHGEMHLLHPAHPPRRDRRRARAAPAARRRNRHRLPAELPDAGDHLRRSSTTPTAPSSRRKATALNYVLLEELNTWPRTSYLALVRNRNPLIETGRGRAMTVATDPLRRPADHRAGRQPALAERGGQRPRSAARRRRAGGGSGSASASPCSACCCHRRVLAVRRTGSASGASTSRSPGVLRSPNMSGGSRWRAAARSSRRCSI